MCKTQGAARGAGATEGGDSSGLFLLLAEAYLSGSRGLRKRGLGQWLPSHRTPGGRGLVPLTYKQGMYTRLPTITSMNSSGEQSSRKSTSALKISEGLRLRANCVPVPLVPSQTRVGGAEHEIRRLTGTCVVICLQGFTRFSSVGSPSLFFSQGTTICKSFDQ